jgi:uncharacterized protein with NRDE domain
MCLTFFCNCSQGSIRFVLGFNRDEQASRETLPFAPFKEDANVYGGRDPKSGGTWLGLNVKTGLLVLLTNYDLPLGAIRLGRSRGQLVYRFLSSAFVPTGAGPQETDELVQSSLKEVSAEGQEYSPFNLAVYNMRSGRTFYMCSEWQDKNPMQLKDNSPYGICNCDILTIWQKTAHGMAMFKNVLENLEDKQEEQVLDEMRLLFQDKRRFSAIDDDESSIFVEPYWCKLEAAERMTKSTLLLLMVEREGKQELVIKEITYSPKGEES